MVWYSVTSFKVHSGEHRTIHIPVAYILCRAHVSKNVSTIDSNIVWEMSRSVRANVPKCVYWQIETTPNRLGVRISKRKQLCHCYLFACRCSIDLHRTWNSRKENAVCELLAWARDVVVVRSIRLCLPSTCTRCDSRNCSLYICESVMEYVHFEQIMLDSRWKKTWCFCRRLTQIMSTGFSFASRM